jgi:hypothetical protein
MVSLKRLLLEEESKLNITIDDVESLLSSRWVNRDAVSLLKTVDAFYYSEKEEEKGWAKDYLTLLNRVMEHIFGIAKRLGVPHVSAGYIKSRLLDESEFKFKMEDFFPFPLYIAATVNADGDWAEIGIMVDQDGKVLEIHEGNDESTPETISLANKLVNPSGKKVRIYGMHGTKVVQQIESTEYLPANLYVSPDRGHSSRHWDNTDRSMFTGIVDINSLSQESEIDWKTVGNTKIEKLRWL